ncbi:hypothetical protein DN748_08280 [Sinomicrobium soli]|nr:hypothetical protein DN748_08280 [Sinomicrobium sp. N-1-3-6]
MMAIKLNVHIMEKAMPFILSLMVGLFPRTEIISQNLEARLILDSLPLNPDITYGKLDNGFTYYIFNNKASNSGEVLMAFVVRAGSRNETLNQNQIAHAIEHIPFTGTLHHPNGIWQDIDFVNLGMRGKYDTNARTFGDYTQYDFNFRGANRKAFITGITYFRDIAGNLYFSGKNTVQVKNEVLQEFQKGYRSPLDTLGSVPILFPGRKSHFNLSELMKDYTVEDFYEFYKHWYIPEKMGLIIVGDLKMGTNVIIEEIKNRFSDLEPSDYTGNQRNYAEEYLKNKEQFIIIEHRILPNPKLKLYLKQPKESQIIKKIDLKNRMVKNVTGALLKRRLQQIKKQYNSGVIGIDAKFQKDYPVFVIDLETTDLPSIQSMLKSAIIVLKQVKDHGFTKSELVSIKEALISEIKAKDFSNNEIVLEECLSHFITREAFPKDKKELQIDLVDKISLNEVNGEFGKRFGPDTSTDLVLLSPGPIKDLDSASIRSWIDQAWRTKVSPYKNDSLPKKIMAETDIDKLAAKPYKIKEGEEVTELKLNNGVKVILKPLKKSKRIFAHGFSPGGASLYTSEDYFSAYNAAGIILHSGVNSIDYFKLREYQKSKSINLMPYINHSEEGIKGSCGKDQFLDFMQLIYLYLTHPNCNEQAYKDWFNNERQFLKGQVTAKERFNDTIAHIIGDHNTLGYSTRLAGLAQTDFKKSYQIYRERFSTAEDFTFVFVGDYDLKNVIPIINLYLGSLPNFNKSNKMNAEVQRIAIHGPKTVKVKEDYDGALVEMCFTKSIQHTVQNETKFKILATILNRIIFNRLRSDDNISYDPRVTHKFYRNPDWIKLSIVSECKIGEEETVQKAVFEELEEIKDNGIKEKDMSYAVHALNRIYLIYKRKANLRLSDLVGQYRDGDESDDIFSLRNNALNNVTSGDIQNFANEILDEANLITFTLSKN